MCVRKKEGERSFVILDLWKPTKGWIGDGSIRIIWALMDWKGRCCMP